MKRDKKLLIRIVISSILFAAAMIAYKLTPLKAFAEVGSSWNVGDYRFYLFILPFLAAYVVAGYDVVVKAGKNLFSGRLLDENFLMVVATFGAIALLDLPEACGVMIFYQVGELFQRYAVGKSRRSIAALMDIRPDIARVLRDGEEKVISPDEVEVGDLLVIRAGERVPVDAVLAEGEGTFDTSSLTGESLPRDVNAGEEVLSGSIDLGGEVKLRALKKYEDSTVRKILDLVENAAAKKAKAENFITKFARYYTPVVVISALLLGVIPPIFLGNWGEWIKRALTFLVVSCPCALVISVPLSFFGGIGGASKKGVLVKGGAALERLADADVFLFDKTGTITKGKFSVVEVFPAERAREILAAAYIAEGASNHPIAKSVVEYAPPVPRDGYEIKEIAGRGVKATKEGRVILVGNASLLAEEGVAYEERNANGSVLYVAENGVWLGCLTLSDTPKENAGEVIRALKAEGARTVMLTGDRESAARAVAEEVGVDEYVAELLPQDKAAWVERYLREKKKGGAVCFIGDGINDAPVLAVSDVGVSMGGVGSDAAIEASDVVLMKDDLASIGEGRKIARRTMRIVRENIAVALGVKVAVLILTAFGVTGAFAMWLAVFADVGVAMLAILNAMRTLR